MDLLADQASDLRSYINSSAPSSMSPAAGAAASRSAPAGGPHHHRVQHQHQHQTPLPPPPTRSPGSAYGDNSALRQRHDSDSRESTKRKSEDDDAAAKQQRSKRNRYISIACNECKRRKIKCNGETPCQRCGNLNLQCLYAPNCCTGNFKDSDEFKQVTEQVARLQEQVDSLRSSMTALRQETFRLAPIQDRNLPLPANSHTVTPAPSTSSIRSLPKPSFSAPPRVPAPFSGPTSINFTVDMAKNTLRNMGYSTAVEGLDDGAGRADDSPALSPALNAIVAPPLSPAQQPDPLWDYDAGEMVRLCRAHEEEVGIMYPVLRWDEVIEHAKFVAAWMDSMRRKGMAPPHVQHESLNDLQTCVLKIVMCCALVVEEHGFSAKATQLYESMRHVIDRKLMSEPSDVNNVPFLVMVAGYRFLLNEEILAWRIIGQVCRLCLELGLHRREGLVKIEDEGARRDALMSFWSAYVLDRRWGFATGLPYVCDDDKIDPKLPMPDTYPYLVAMITYSRLAAKIWRLVDYFEPAVVRELKHTDFDQLDNEILQWYDTVPEEIKVATLGLEIPMPTAPSYNVRRLQIWTRLRLNQIRTWLHTPVLHSASSIAENMPLAQRAVDLSKETIQFLNLLNNTSDLYRRIQVFYHQFLTSAIAVLFLASTHAPLQFSSQCRTEFYMALDLVRNMSAHSWMSQRLWRTVRSLKAYAPRLGLGEDNHRSGAAMTMADLASGGSTGGITGTAGQQNNLNALASASIGRTPSSSRGRPTLNHFGATAPPQPRSPPALLLPHQQQAHGNGMAAEGEDQDNGHRLGTEMKAVFEGYMGLNGRRQAVPMPMAHLHPSDPLTPGSMNVVSPENDLDGAGVYPIVRDLF